MLCSFSWIKHREIFVFQREFWRCAGGWKTSWAESEGVRRKRNTRCQRKETFISFVLSAQLSRCPQKAKTNNFPNFTMCLRAKWSWSRGRREGNRIRTVCVFYVFLMYGIAFACRTDNLFMDFILLLFSTPYFANVMSVFFTLISIAAFQLVWHIYLRQEFKWKP